MRVDVIFNVVRTATALAVVCGVPRADGARILAIQTVAGRSHWNFVSSVLRALTDNGHNVTVYTPFLDGNRENYTEVDISGKLPELIEKSMLEMKNNMAYTSSTVSFVITLGRLTCSIFHDDRELRALTTENLSADFDAVLVEPILPNCFSYLAAESNLPLIYAYVVSMTFGIEHEVLGDIPNPATVAPLTGDHAVPKTFAQRFSNTVFRLYCHVLIMYHEFLQKTIDPRPYDAYTYTPPSLVFMNSHFISDAARPISQNVVNVGGIHLKPVEKIPEDILEFIESSPDGVILFTFGSTVRMSAIPEDIRKSFMDAFGRLPQRVLLKYDGEMTDRPRNVMTRKWLPQRDILAHPNVKLFVSHGGISGLYEAVDAGVPVLGFPMFSDQYRNVDNLVEAGMAISMEILTVTENAFLENVVALVNDEKYRRNAKIASKIFNDRPMSPQREVVYWTEYVIRHKGAPHLKSHGLNLSLYQYLLLDVVGVASIVSFAVLFAIFRLFKIIKMYTFSFLRFSVEKKND